MKFSVERLLQAPERTTRIPVRETIDFPTDLGTLTRPLEGEVTIQLTEDGRFMRVLGDVTTGADLICDRCLGPVPTDVDVQVDETLEIGEESEEHETVGAEFDLGELLRQHVILSLPSRKLCGCEPAHLVTKERVDPRWEALEALKRRSEEER